MASFLCHMVFRAILLLESLVLGSTLGGKIVGGVNTTIEEHPFQLALYYKGYHNGGATILSATVAITAAHCVFGRTPDQITLRSGSTSVSTGGVVHNVKTIHEHPKYDNEKSDYDVAVLIVETPFVFGPTVRAIQLRDLGEKVPLGTFCTSTGWGAFEYGGVFPDNLQMVGLPKVSNRYCRYANGRAAITDRMTCYGYQEDGKDTCQNDSGGPLVCDNKLVGITSFGYKCARAGYPGVYARITNPEIHQHITQYLN